MIEFGDYFVTPDELVDLGHDHQWLLTPQRQRQSPEVHDVTNEDLLTKIMD